MRSFFAKHLESLAEQDDRVILLYGDIGNKLFDGFKEKFPDRFFNCGVAEANMVGVAAGLAKSGFKPWVYTINSFLYLKALEQIKLDVCYQGLPVTLVGTGGGLGYSELGTTHHSLEDFGVLSQIPQLTTYAPGTISILTKTMNHVLKKAAPAYIRLGKKESYDPPLECIEDLSGNLEVNMFPESVTSPKIAILSTGTIIDSAQEAVEKLCESRIFTVHFHVSQVSPLSENLLKKLLVKYSKVFVVEDHYPNGGLYPQLCMLKSSQELSFKLHRIGPPFEFFAGLGELKEARESLSIGPDAIFEFVSQRI